MVENAEAATQRTSRNDAIASRRRRATAVKVAADLGSAPDLDQVLATAVLGLEVLFDGKAGIRVPTASQDGVITSAGEVLLSELPEPSRTALTEARVPPTEKALQDSGQPRNGILLGSLEADRGCLAWIQLATPRTIPIDELIVGDLLVHAIDLAVDRTIAASTFAERQAHLQRALVSHRAIGQAIGVLVERHRLTPEEAFARLRDASQARNLKLRDIAARIVETGQEPEDA
ncbi:MAG: ANTAR domain-containing response regulator [Brooklawnia sp.]|jgi:hypothetical protein